MKMSPVIALPKARQPIATALALAMIAGGLVALPLVGGASGVGITSGKYGSQQVFDVQRSPAFPECTDSDDNIDYLEFTVSSPATPISDSSAEAVNFEPGDYIMFFDNGDADMPWGIRYFNSADVERRWSPVVPVEDEGEEEAPLEDEGEEEESSGGSWVTAEEADALGLNFNTLKPFSEGGQIFGLGSEGFLHTSAANDYGTFVSNAGPLGDELTYTPDPSLNDCNQALYAVANKEVALSTYVANSTPNSVLGSENTEVNTDPIDFKNSIGPFVRGASLIDTPIASADYPGDTFYAVTDDLNSNPADLGLSLNSETGSLTGTPNVVGAFTLTIARSVGELEIQRVTYNFEIYQYAVLNNGYMRFGSGTVNSLNDAGIFRQPFYNAGTLASPIWRKLTFSSLDLNLAFGVGSGNPGHWAGNTDIAEATVNNVSNLKFDYSKYTSGSVNASYASTTGSGKIVVSGDYQVGTKILRVSTTYSLGPGDNFVKVDHNFTNPNAQTLENLIIWAGTSDDWVGERFPGQLIDSDRPTKVRGNLTGPNSSFAPLANGSDKAQALKINTEDDGVLFFSTTPNTDMAVSFLGFGNAYGVDPSSLPVEIVGQDSSYAAVLRAGDLTQGSQQTITWFYAAGPLASLDSVAQSVASAAAPPAPTVTRSNGSATLNWQEPEKEDGTDIVWYEYRIADITGGVSPVWITQSTTLSVARTPYTLTSYVNSSNVTVNLTNTNNYIFQVRAITQSAANPGVYTPGAWSSSSTGSILGAPDAPTLNSAVGGNGQATVSFTTPASPVSEIESYEYCLQNCTTEANWKNFLGENPPAGASLPTSPFTISPLANGQSYNIQIRAVNIHGGSNPSSTIALVTNPVWTSSSDVTVVVDRGTNSTTALLAINPEASAQVTYSNTGSLPPGISLNSSTGALSGTPNTGGKWVFNLIATNSAGSISKEITLVVLPYIVMSPSSISTNLGAAVSQSIRVIDGSMRSLSGGATATASGLPDGMSYTVSGENIDNSMPTVLLSGSPTTTGTFTITVTMTFADSSTASYEISVAVGEALPPSSSGGGTAITPTPTASPSPSSTPRPTPSPTSTPAVLAPIASPTPEPSLPPVPNNSPIALMTSIEPTPGVVYSASNPIPAFIVDLLAKPLAYIVAALSGDPELPALRPSESLAYENGEPVVIELVVTDNGNGYVLRGDGWEVALEATDSSGAPLLLDESGNIILNNDRFVEFSGTGFAPGSVVKVWLFSEPTGLSDALADSSGNFTGKALIPEGVPTGEHTIQLNGLTKDGQLRSVSLGVVIQPELIVAAPVGFDLSGLMNWLLVLAAAVLAVFFFILWRRRKKKEEEISPEDIGEVIPIFASEGLQPAQQFPDDSRRKVGPAAPPNRKRFNFKPKGV